jgi:FtsZ-binding cell division protein ZapB
VDIANLKKTIHQLDRERTNLQGEISEQRRENHRVTEEVQMRDVKVRSPRMLWREEGG